MTKMSAMMSKTMKGTEPMMMSFRVMPGGATAFMT